MSLAGRAFLRVARVVSTVSLVAALAGCAAPESRSPCCPAENGWYAGGGPSYGPDVGASVEVGRILARNPRATWSVEARATYLFVDNTEILNSGSGLASPDWKQFEAGAKVAWAPNGDPTHRVTGRFGLAVADVAGNLNRVRDEGAYYGGYAGVGFETQVTERLTVGPSVTALVLSHEDGGSPYVIPRLDWHVTWNFGGTCLDTTCDDVADECRPRREFYVGAVATGLPGLGGGFEFGQVFGLGFAPGATWSFEVQGTKQTLDGVFGGTVADSDLAQLRIGAKASLWPERRRHVVGRFGFCALKATGTNDYIDLATTYHGPYVGVGYEWDFGSGWTTGPDVSVLVGFREGGGGTDVIPQVGWHLVRWL